MNITLSNAGAEIVVDVPVGSTAGYIRRLRDSLEEIGAPSSFNLAVNGNQVDDDFVLAPNQRVAFRPLTGDKG